MLGAKLIKTQLKAYGSIDVPSLIPRCKAWYPTNRQNDPNGVVAVSRWLCRGLAVATALFVPCAQAETMDRVVFDAGFAREKSSYCLDGEIALPHPRPPASNSACVHVEPFSRAKAWELVAARSRAAGTPAGYYVHENPDSKGWVIYLQGGGLCVTPFDCAARAKNGGKEGQV